MTGGGTLGHCRPCLALLPYVKDHFDKIIYVGSETGPERRAVEGTLDYTCIPTVKFVRSFNLKNLTIPFRLAKSVACAEAILKRERATLVFSKGGYVALPVCIAAAKLSIPVVSHESDLTVGLSNRLTAKKSKFFLTSFKETAEKYQNGVYVGPPLSKEILADRKLASREKFSLDFKKPVLLVVGGSSGAKAVNDFVRTYVDEFLKSYEILHICGEKHISGVKKRGYCEVGFLNDMSLAYSCADLALSRCGSNTAFELLARNIPTLFVPLPAKASRGDQIENARYFTEKKLALSVKEEELSVAKVSELLSELSKNRKSFAKNMREFVPLNALEKTSEIVISVAKND